MYQGIRNWLTRDTVKEGFDVESLHVAQDIDPSAVPEEVQAFMWNFVKNPLGMHALDASLLSNITLYDRSDGLQTFAVVVRPHPSLAIRNPVAIVVDYDRKSNDVVGEALAEASLGNSHMELRVFDTYTKRRGHHLSYPRLKLLNMFGYDTLKTLLSSASLTKHADTEGLRAPEEYAAAEHVWEALKADLDKKNDRFQIEKRGGAYYFQLRKALIT